jgi:tetrahydromethanopterin S-methyltransferase subunit B
MAIDDVDDRIEHAKRGLEEKLSELQRRVDHTREVLSPSRYLQSGWVRLGLGIAGGYVAGRVLGFIPVGAIVKRLVVIASTALLKEAFEQWRRGESGFAFRDGY